MSLARRVFSERRAVLIPLTILLIGNVVVLASVVWPLQRSVDGAQNAQYEATQRLAAAKALEAEAKGDREGKDRADVELGKFYSEVLPKDYPSAVSAATFSLSRLADVSRVTFKIGQWDREEVRDSRLSRVTGQVTLIGEYANIRKFLYEVETAQEFVILDSVELAAASSAQSESLLELVVNVSSYFMTNTAPAGANR